MSIFRLRRRLLVPAAVLLMAGAGALGWRSHAAESAGAVTIADFAFGPATLTVPRGTRVVWTNKDDEPHTVVNDGGTLAFKSPALDTDDSFAVSFDQAGTYKYFCSVHPRMQGTVVVQ